jgi:hypothetical protein
VKEHAANLCAKKPPTTSITMKTKQTKSAMSSFL